MAAVPILFQTAAHIFGGFGQSGQSLGVQQRTCDKCPGAQIMATFHDRQGLGLHIGKVRVFGREYLVASLFFLSGFGRNRHQDKVSIILEVLAARAVPVLDAKQSVQIHCMPPLGENSLNARNKNKYPDMCGATRNGCSTVDFLTLPPI